MKILTASLLGFATGLFLSRLLSIPFWLELTIVAAIALLLWIFTSDKLSFKERQESKE